MTDDIVADNVVAFIRPDPKPDTWRETRRRILERHEGQCDCARPLNSPGPPEVTP